MASESIKTIKTAAGDYTSLSAWEAGEQGDLTGVRDEIAVAECYSFEDTTAVSVTGWTTDATRYIKIYTPTSERHDGKWSTSKYRLNVASGIALNIGEENVRVEGLQLMSDDLRPMRLSAFTSAADFRLSHNIFKGNGTATFSGMVDVTALPANSEARVWNNIFFDGTAAGQAAINLNDADLTIWFFNNTIKDCSRGITLSNVSQEYIKNNLIDATDAFVGTFTDDDTYNDYNSISQNDNNVALGSNGRYNQSFTYENEGADDFHLASGDAGAKDFGVDLSGDGNLAFSDDIDGDTRSGTWDIGADEFVAVGTIVQDVIGTGIIPFLR